MPRSQTQSRPLNGNSGRGRDHFNVRGRGNGRLRAIDSYKPFKQKQKFMQNKFERRFDQPRFDHRGGEPRSWSRSRSRSLSHSRSPSRYSRQGSDERSGSRGRRESPARHEPPERRVRSPSIDSSIASSRPSSRAPSRVLSTTPEPAPASASPSLKAKAAHPLTQSYREFSPVPGLNGSYNHAHVAVAQRHRTPSPTRPSHDSRIGDQAGPSSAAGVREVHRASPTSTSGRSSAPAEISPATPPDEPALASPLAAPSDGGEVPYLTIGRAPFNVLDNFSAPESSHVQKNLFPNGDSAFWRSQSKPFLNSLHKSVVRTQETPEEMLRNRVKAVLLDNRSLQEAVSSRFDDDGEDVESDRFMAKHQALVPHLAESISAAQSTQLDKIETLRDKYKRLNDSWVAHCARLDALKADPALSAGPMDLPVHVGRLTRRNTGVQMSDTVRSELEMEQILATLGNEDMTDPNQLYHRNVAVIPDMVSVHPTFVPYRYDDTNRFVDEPAEFYEDPVLVDWTKEEEETFKLRFAEYPKQFGMIAAALPNKTTQDCVVFYYMTKKTRINYAEVLATYGTKRRGRRKLGKGGALLADIQKSKHKASPIPFPAVQPPPPPPPQAQAPPPTIPAATYDSPAPVRTTARPRAAANKPSYLISSDEDTSEASVPVRRKQARASTGSKATPGAAVPGQPAKKGGRKAKEPAVTDPSVKKKIVNSYWSVGEKARVLALFHELGKDFDKIAEQMPEKSVVQVGNYYKANAIVLGLEQPAQLIVAPSTVEEPMPVEEVVVVPPS